MCVCVYEYAPASSKAGPLFHRQQTCSSRGNEATGITFNSNLPVLAGSKQIRFSSQSGVELVVNGRGKEKKDFKNFNRNVIYQGYVFVCSGLKDIKKTFMKFDRLVS